MMKIKTAEERKQEFVMLYNEACERTGWQIADTATGRQLNKKIIQVESGLDIVEIENWQPPAADIDKAKDD